MQLNPRAQRIVEAAIVAGFFALYLASFELASSVNGPYEVFGQDSPYVLKGLDQGQRYRWNPQSHLLYHWVVDHAYVVWKMLLGPGIESTYRYLKLLTALCGLAFLVAMRWLFLELRLSFRLRCVMLVLTGGCLSSWFHFAAFETHALALPALALYLVALARLAQREQRGWADRLLFVGSLVVCGLSRVDLFRFAVATAPLLLLPALRQHWRSLRFDLALVAVLWVAGNSLLALSYLDVRPGVTPVMALHRRDHSEPDSTLGRVANLRLHALAAVGRTISLYSIAMPIEAPPAGRGFFAPPSNELRLEPKEMVLPSSALFLKPARYMAGSALSLLALVGVTAALCWAIASAIRRAARGDPFHAGLLLQAVIGWLLYTWFNPAEPFLWVAEFAPLWMAMLATASRERSRLWAGLALLAVVVLSHNAFAFYLPFR